MPHTIRSHHAGAGDRRAHRVTIPCAAFLAALLAVLLALAVLPRSAHGQPLAELQAGARVRFRAPAIVAGRVTGTIVGRAGDTLVVAGEKGSPLRVPVPALAGIEVSRGKSRTRGALWGALWGAGVGTLGGLLVATAPNDTTRDGEYTSDWEYLYGSAIGGALIGLPIGAVIGRERWERFELPVQLRVAPQPGGLAARITLRR